MQGRHMSLNVRKGSCCHYLDVALLPLAQFGIAAFSSVFCLLLAVALVLLAACCSASMKAISG